MAIFRDREKLSPRYVPSTLPHRQEQIGLLHGHFKDALARPSEMFLRIVQIIGPAGTGKTSAVVRFGETFQGEARRAKIDLHHVYVNLKLYGGSRVVLYRYVLEKVAPEIYSPGLSAEEMLRQLLRYLQERRRYLIFSLDEIDYFLKSTKDTGVIYDLTRLNELEPGRPCNVLGVLFTARSRGFHERLDPAELSTLGRIPIEFPRYTADQIVDILEERAKEALQPKAISEEVLEYVADITAAPPVNGDVRYALDVLAYSGSLAEADGGDSILPEHVRRVHGEIHPSITTEEIMNLPKKEHLLALLAVVRALKGRRRPYAGLGDVRLACGVVCEELGFRAVDDIEDYLQDLHDRRIIDIQSLREMGISGAPTEDLESFLDGLIQRVKSGLVEGR